MTASGQTPMAAIRSRDYPGRAVGEVRQAGGGEGDLIDEHVGEVSRVNVAVAKTWRMLSREGGRYRCPIGKFESMLAAVTGLFFFAEYSND